MPVKALGLGKGALVCLAGGKLRRASLLAGGRRHGGFGGPGLGGDELPYFDLVGSTSERGEPGFEGSQAFFMKPAFQQPADQRDRTNAPSGHWQRC